MTPKVGALMTAASLVAAAVERDLDATLDALADLARELLAADAAAIHLAVPGTDQFERRRLNPLADPAHPSNRVGTRFSENGPAREAFATGRPVFTPDLHASPDVEPRTKEILARVRSDLVVPLIAAGERVGVMFCSWQERIDPSQVDLDAAHALGQHAASAIRTARLLAETRAQLDRMAALRRISAAASATGDLDDLLTRVLVESTRLVNTNRGVVALVDHDRRHVRARVGWNAPEGLVEATVRELFSEAHPEEDIFALVVRTGEQIVAGDDHPALHAETAARFGMSGRTRVLTSISHAGETIGVIALSWFGPATPSEDDLALLRLIGEQVGGAVSRARLLEDAERARIAARQAADEMAAVLEQMGDAVIVTDELGTIVSANAAAGRLVGMRPEEMVGGAPEDQPWRLYTPEGEPVSPKDSACRRALQGEEVTVEYRIDAADGEVRWGWISARAVRDHEGRVRRAVVVVRDVTERRAAERRAEDMARADQLRALGQLAGGIAHDLNQSLGLVLGYSELVERGLKEIPVDVLHTREMLQTIAQAAADGGETVRRLLVFAREREPGAAQRVAVGSLIEEVVRLTAPVWRDTAQAQGRAIAVAVEAGEDAVVDGYPASLRQALTNLVLNAVDAMPGGGTLRLEARRNGDQVEVLVSDTGIGMPPEVQRRIFEPFFTTKGERGSGLGMPMVFGVVDRHGGTIEVDSQAGRGTTVRLKLPAVLDGPAVRGPTEGSSRSSLRLLVVDDEIQLARMAGMMLEQAGHTVALATSAEEALAQIEKAPFDVVLSDLGLGAGMNGWELAEQVRARWPTTGFVLVTGWGAGIDPARARASGVDAVVAKPYRPIDLRRALGTIRPRGAAASG